MFRIPVQRSHRQPGIPTAQENRRAFARYVAHGANGASQGSSHHSLATAGDGGRSVFGKQFIASGSINGGIKTRSITSQTVN